MRLAPAAVVLAAACASASGTAGSSWDPTGIYDVTLASEGMVGEGTMTVRGIPGAYRGTLSAGGVSAEIRRVEVGNGDVNIRAETAAGMLILRLLRDGSYLTGNWVLGERRGTVVAQRRESPGPDPHLSPAGR